VLATGAEERAVHNAMRHELDKVPIPLHGEKTKDRDRACFVVLPWQKAYLADAKKHMDGENGKAFTDWANSCRDLEAACLAADVPYASLHGLRHVFGGWALDDGLSMNTVGKALGHKDLRQLMLTYDNRDPKVIQWRAEQEAADRAHRPKLRAIKGGKANSKAAKGPTTRQRRSYEKKAATG
jgi:integrase